MCKYNNSNKIKILITYKERHKLLKSDILTPIQSGRLMAKEIFHDMIGDDTGDNISNLNGKYSELSALYWAWKNYDKLGNPEYIGHMHYRRQFLFDKYDDKNFSSVYRKYSSFYEYLDLDSNLIDKFSDEKIKQTVTKYDYLIPEWHYAPTRNIALEYIYNIPGAKKSIWDKFIEICKQKHKDYKDEIQQIELGNKVLICNMFIMKKELFFKYCEFAFPVLEELEKSIDTKNLTKNGLRFLGYMAEKLLSIFILRLQKDNTLKYKYLDCSYVLNPDNENLKFFYIKRKYYKILSKMFPKNDFYRRRLSFYNEIKIYNRRMLYLNKMSKK